MRAFRLWRAIGLTLLGLTWAGFSLPTITSASEPRQEATPRPPDTPSAQWARAREVYRLWCSTCHGNRGQGLTLEWRETWDPKDQNCWQSKCHSLNHPPDGFVLPRYVPAIVGASALRGFSSAESLNAFLRQEMPYQEPGVLSEQDYWDLTAYLLHENGIPLPSAVLGLANAPEIQLSGNEATPAAEPPTTTGNPGAIPMTNTSPNAATSEISGRPVPIWAFVILGVALGSLFLFRERRGGGPSDRSGPRPGGSGGSSIHA